MDGGPAPAFPVIHVDSFDGPLDRLLDLARAQQVDLAEIAVADLVDPFVAAIAQQAKTTPLAQLGDWLVTASWLTLLKSRLLLPAGAPEAAQAQHDAAQLRHRLADAAHVQALAAWLEARPQLGRDVFARGGRDAPVPAPPAEGDLLDLLLACFDVYDAPITPIAPVYRPIRRLDLYSVQAAVAQIRHVLIEHPEGGELALFLPPRRADQASVAMPPLRARSMLASTFLAGLELTRQDVVQMAQTNAFEDIHLQATAVAR